MHAVTEMEIYQHVYERESCLHSTGNTECAYVAPGISDSSRIHCKLFYSKAYDN